MILFTERMFVLIYELYSWHPQQLTVTITTTVTEISVSSNLWNYYYYIDGHQLTVQSIKTYRTVLLLDVPRMTAMITK